MLICGCKQIKSRNEDYHATNLKIKIKFCEYIFLRKKILVKINVANLTTKDLPITRLFLGCLHLGFCFLLKGA